MANRMISYGYGFNCGEIAIIEKEANIVKRVFQEYIDGKILKDIANELTSEGIEFYLGNCTWNKGKILRIIENEKYIGADGYPQIIDDDDFVYAGKLKSQKGAKKIHQSSDIEYIRDKVICSQCGRTMRRISKWRSREKWLCRNGCKNEIYLSDVEIFGGIYTIVYKIINNLEQYKTIVANNGYVPTKEITRETNEFNRLLGETKPSFSVGKKLVLNLARLKFLSCNEDKSNVYTDLVLTEMQRVIANGLIDEEFLKKVVTDIRVEKSGCIRVKFINGIELTNEEEENGKQA